MLCMLVGVGTPAPREKKSEYVGLSSPCFPPLSNNEAEEPFLSESRLEVFTGRPGRPRAKT
jgi:hypothetical protein